MIFLSYVSLPEGTYFTVAYTFTFRKTDKRKIWVQKPGKTWGKQTAFQTKIMFPLTLTLHLPFTSTLITAYRHVYIPT